MAAGTVAGAIDMSFNTSAALEIFSLDFASGAEAPQLVGSVPVPERFNRLVWGQSPSPQAHMPVSLLCASGVCVACWSRLHEGPRAVREAA